MMLRNTVIFIVALIILSLEQLAGLPCLFFAVILWLTSTQSPGIRQLILAVAGLAIAVTYHVPLAGGWLLLVAMAFVWQHSQVWLKNDTFRLLLLSALGCGVIAVAAGFEITTPALFSLLISLLVTYSFGQAVFLLSITSGKLQLTPSIRLVSSEKL